MLPKRVTRNAMWLAALAAARSSYLKGSVYTVMCRFIAELTLVQV